MKPKYQMVLMYSVNFSLILILEKIISQKYISVNYSCVIIRIWEMKEYNRKAVWISKMKKELGRPEKDPEAKLHLDSHKATLKKY